MLLTALGAFAVGSAALLVQAATYTQLVATPAWQERQVERLDGFLLRHQEEVAWTLDALGLPVEEGEAPTAAGLYADLRAELAPALGFLVDVAGLEVARFDVAQQALEQDASCGLAGDGAYACALLGAPGAAPEELATRVSNTGSHT